MEMMTNELVLEYSYLATNLCILHRDKRMKMVDFTYCLLGFLVVYLSIQLVLAYFGGYL
jgi:hypothetical protein